MATIAIVGDGPGALSAAIFLARGNQDVVIFGDDKTAVNFALLSNYLGVEQVAGPDFQAAAVRQAEQAGADIRRSRVASVEPTSDGFALTSEDGDGLISDYLILSEGRTHPLADSLSLDTTDGGAVAVDSQFRASMSHVYVIGRSARPKRSQAIISAGAGATAALDILADITGDDVQDWDSLPGA